MLIHYSNIISTKSELPKLNKFNLLLISTCCNLVILLITLFNCILGCNYNIKDILQILYLILHLIPIICFYIYFFKINNTIQNTKLINILLIINLLLIGNLSIYILILYIWIAIEEFLNIKFLRYIMSGFKDKHRRNKLFLNYIFDVLGHEILQIILLIIYCICLYKLYRLN